MEATAAASLARTLASCCSPADPAVAACAWPWRRSGGGGVGQCSPRLPPSSKTGRLVLRRMAVAQRVSHLTTTAACRPSLLPSMATATSGVSRLSAAAGNNDGDVGLQDPIPASVGICRFSEFGTDGGQQQSL
ncbi:uncharacterized protein LOC119324855 isoform X2 [Triticum dicoccoides]|uniref:uncharacterized protein LOC119324855 isoform X2 n=1 Tax=Triticum dicoccoides TaxID=85692 RepID=UPI0018918E9F|nr:uncharacterized protein LOC119324855 isoform X2 [Triticum dicoccoides]